MSGPIRPGGGPGGDRPRRRTGWWLASTCGLVCLYPGSYAAARASHLIVHTVSVDADDWLDVQLDASARDLVAGFFAPMIALEYRWRFARR